jgi:hypothetical protein
VGTIIRTDDSATATKTSMFKVKASQFVSVAAVSTDGSYILSTYTLQLLTDTQKSRFE